MVASRAERCVTNATRSAGNPSRTTSATNRRSRTNVTSSNVCSHRGVLRSPWVNKWNSPGFNWPSRCRPPSFQPNEMGRSPVTNGQPMPVDVMLRNLLRLQLMPLDDDAAPSKRHTAQQRWRVRQRLPLLTSTSLMWLACVPVTISQKASWIEPEGQGSRLGLVGNPAWNGQLDLGAGGSTFAEHVAAHRPVQRVPASGQPPVAIAPLRLDIA